VQSIAVACKAGAVSTRYFLGLVRPFNPMVQGSSPWRLTNSFKRLRDSLICFDFSRGRIGPFGVEFGERKVALFALQRM